jgi:hypothetical protein
MADKKSAQPSAASIARADRQRLASEEGARAMADVERQAMAIRQNMERLRVLREAKRAEDAKIQAALPPVKKKVSKKSPAKTALKMS